jgi:hypothetical protein
MRIGVKINLERADDPVYRIFCLPHFRSATARRELVLVDPHLWDDPLENLLDWCMIHWVDEPTRPGVSFASLRKPIYAQCWSQVRESDTLWRAYSRFSKDDTAGRNRFPDDEGVQVRSTPRKLLRALGKRAPSNPEESCFIGGVSYLKRDQLTQFIANEVERGQLEAFGGARGHAESVLFKRDAYEHETEVRLIYVDLDERFQNARTLAVTCPIEEVFDEIVFDPRLATFERLEREEEARKLGYTGPIGRSDLYQRALLEIPVRTRKS